jgi:DNA-directed RNA polymerase subunit RPC12/RpoP
MGEERFYQKGRYTKIKGYQFDKYIFRAMFIILLLSVIIVWIMRGGGDPRTEYIHLVCPCDQPRPCANPLYQNYQYAGWPGISDELLDTENILPCFEINRPPIYIKFFGEVVILMIIIAILINHLAHNRGYDFKNLFKELNEEVNNMESEQQNETQAYCVKCKHKQIIKDKVLEDVNTSRGVKRFAKGTCPVCGTKVMVTVSRKKEE